MILRADARAIPLKDESVQCVCTSPPFWGLRDYGIAEQLGLEASPAKYVENMVEVFREVHRVLHPSGTLWLNLGDCYATGAGKVGDCPGGGEQGERWAGRDDHKGRGTPPRCGGRTRGPRPGAWYERENPRKNVGPIQQPNRMPIAGLKPKDLVGIPWRVAFALQQPYYTGQIPDERDRTWLAALMDGEGTFTILSTTSPHGSGNSYPPIAQVRMTSSGVVAKAASLVGVMSPAQYPPSATSNRAVYQWRLSGKRAADMAHELYPYLIEKRKQAIIAWNHQAVRDGYETKRGVPIPVAAVEKQLLCRDLIRRLNHGGHVDLPSWMVEPPSLLKPGFYLRSDVIWSKPNPMPESIKDRPTKAHEYIFLLTKSERYFYDADAIREPHTYGEGGGHHRNVLDAPESHAPGGAPHTGLRKSPNRVPSGWDTGPGNHRQMTGRYKTSGPGPHAGGRRQAPEPGEPCAFHPLGRNKRSVWTIATQPYPGSHFATFPEEIPRLCILAGSRPGDVILDPFGGSGTTAKVALELGRKPVHIDLTYHELARKRMTTTPAMAGLMGK